LTSIPTLLSGLRKSCGEARAIKDTFTARRDMKQLERMSESLTSLIFEPDGLRYRLRNYVENPKSRLSADQIKASLNHSHEVYGEALKR
jgi:hypothetical protein